MDFSILFFTVCWLGSATFQLRAQLCRLKVKSICTSLPLYTCIWVKDNQTPIYSSMMGIMWRFKFVHNATSVALIQVLEWPPSLFVRRCYSKLLHIQDPVLLWEIFFFGLHCSACYDGGCLISFVVSCTYKCIYIYIYIWITFLEFSKPSLICFKGSITRLHCNCIQFDACKRTFELFKNYTTTDGKPQIFGCNASSGLPMYFQLMPNLVNLVRFPLVSWKLYRGLGRTKNHKTIFFSTR